MLRLRLRLAEAVLSVDKDDARVTARIGISSCQRAETKGEHVLQLADDALYAAKVAGPLNRGRPDLICARHGRRRHFGGRVRKIVSQLITVVDVTFD